jgi:hypothetical protein
MEVKVKKLTLIVAMLLIPVIALAQAAADSTAAGGSNALQTFISWLNDPQWKFLMAFVGGFIMRAAPQIENKAIPVVLQVMNVVTLLLGGLFGAKFAPGIVTACAPWLDPQTGPVVAAGFLGNLHLGAILDAVASVALASGVQSQAKNAAQWWTMGRSILKQR